MAITVSRTREPWWRRSMAPMMADHPAQRGSTAAPAWWRRSGAPRGRHHRGEPAYEPPPRRAGIHRAEGGLLRSLYDQHAEPLLMIILEMTGGDRRLAEAVVRETLVSAWRDVDAIDVSASSLRPWLVSLARRILRDMTRRREATAVVSDPEPADRFPVVELEDDVGQALQRMMVLDGLRALQRPDREILVEAYFRGRGVRDVAEELGLPPETVKWRLFFALRALQKILLGHRGDAAAAERTGYDRAGYDEPDYPRARHDEVDRGRTPSGWAGSDDA